MVVNMGRSALQNNTSCPLLRDRGSALFFKQWFSSATLFDVVTPLITQHALLTETTLTFPLIGSYRRFLVLSLALIGVFLSCHWLLQALSFSVIGPYRRFPVTHEPVNRGGLA